MSATPYQVSGTGVAAAAALGDLAPTVSAPRSARRRTPSSPRKTLLPAAAEDAPDPAASTTLPSPLGEPERRATLRATAWHRLLGKWKALAFGQLLSLVLAGSGFLQSALYLDCHLSAPTFSMLSFYLPLSVLCIARLLWRERGRASPGREKPPPRLQAQAGGGPVHEAPIAQSATLPSSETKRKAPVLVARPEKRNHLLSRWSRGDAEAADAGFYFNRGGGSCDAASSQAPQTAAHALFGVVPLRAPLRTYLVIALVDVYANYTTILAFKYTTITSVSLFDALAIPAAIVVSRLCFGRRYTRRHLLGVAVCGAGIALNVWQDYREDQRLAATGGAGESVQEQLLREEYPHKTLGDALAIAGGLLFGVSNTLAEVAVREADTTEYLACMAACASVVSAVQVLCLEREAVAAFFAQQASDTCSEGQGLALFSAFSLAGVVNYVGIASFLQISDAAFFNLSLLTGDAWAVAFSVFAEGIVPSYSFYAALAVTLSGVVVYETAPSPVVATTPSASGGAPPPEPSAVGAARSAVGGREPGTQEGLVIA